MDCIDSPLIYLIIARSLDLVQDTNSGWNATIRQTSDDNTPWIDARDGEKMPWAEIPIWRNIPDAISGLPSPEADAPAGHVTRSTGTEIRTAENSER